MIELKIANGKTEITAQDHAINVHQYLLAFLAKFNEAKRGGIHDFMEITLFNMISSAIKNIDDYLACGHVTIDGTQIMNIVADSYQKVLDNIKRNIGEMDRVNMR